ncbi:hypothetical protein [Oryza sativa Japonica Group]|uniref:Uncharacterized protein n=1 Tax=Oryza sativa subsp. japonica TaxID=39947 RepID=Q5QM70_ORYSJ|nr:hypothetical protein [Oryza sativa Japonica Group]
MAFNRKSEWVDPTGCFGGVNDKVLHGGLLLSSVHAMDGRTEKRLIWNQDVARGHITNSLEVRITADSTRRGCGRKGVEHRFGFNTHDKEEIEKDTASDMKRSRRIPRRTRKGDEEDSIWTQNRMINLPKLQQRDSTGLQHAIEQITRQGRNQFRGQRGLLATNLGGGVWLRRAAVHVMEELDAGRLQEEAADTGVRGGRLLEAGGGVKATDVIGGGVFGGGVEDGSDKALSALGVPSRSSLRFLRGFVKTAGNGRIATPLVKNQSWCEDRCVIAVVVPRPSEVAVREIATYWFEDQRTSRIISRTPMEVAVREIATYWFENQRASRIISRTPMEVAVREIATYWFENQRASRIISRTPMGVVVWEIATYWFENQRASRIISRTPMEVMVGRDDSAFVKIILDNAVYLTTTYSSAQLFLKNIF